MSELANFGLDNNQTSQEPVAEPAQDPVVETEQTAEAADPVADDDQNSGVDAAPPADGDDQQSEPEATDEGDASEDKRVPVAEIVKQREKRREAEAALVASNQRLAYLEGQLSNKGAGEGEDPPDLNNPYWDNPHKAVQEQVGKAVFETRLSLTEDAMAEKHEDYVETVNKFAAIAKEDDSLAIAFYRARNPAKFAYDHIKRLNAPQGTDTKEVDSLKKEIAELKAEKEEAQRKSDALKNASETPKTQAGARGSGADAVMAKDVPNNLGGCLGLP